MALADSFQGDLYAIDPKAPSVTLSATDKLLTYRVRPDGEITINGARGEFQELNTGMTASWDDRDGTWKMTAPGKVEAFSFFSADRPPDVITVNPDATILKWDNGARSAKRVKP